MHRLVSSDTNLNLSIGQERRSHIEPDNLLNSYSPIYSLPREILSLIFEIGKAWELYDSFFVDDDTSEYHPPIPALEILLTHVSSHFRDITIGTHALWTSIHITTTISLEEVKTYMTRSDGLALSVRIDDPTPIARTKEKIGSILPHLDRYRKLIIHATRETTGLPIIRCFSNQDAPRLKHLSVSVEDVEEGIVATGTNLLMGGAPLLSFVRLRGLAVPLFKPPLYSVTTLHLDQTISLPIQYVTFCHMLTASPSLKNLSIHGDIIDTAWPIIITPINLPSLRSLRVCGIDGLIYSNLLLRLNAPGLNSLVLKDVQEADLDQFWASPDVYKFPFLHHLSFNNFEVSGRAYIDVFRAFPAITHFTTTYSFRTPMILHLLAQWSTDRSYEIPWANLHTLNFYTNLGGGDLIKNVVQARATSGHPLKKLGVGIRSELSLLPHYHWLKTKINLEEFQGREQWPGDGSCFDPDDDLFD
ncbi:hypothetical protein BDZ94DRAFT_137479 [Collybia nuda]|uniref:F-box domain-containing protein n=1 Tax=Collybia nuda TaxID=64659 RepID=A0A9P6CNB0_9AGAR|nr:hypothetical protein BDZ94DRAFT_137479 [Collybia nuda]